MDDDKKWYAVYTSPRCEKKVAGLLSKKGIENYCPLNKVMKQWSDRKKIVSEPLFKSYVFVRIESADRISIYRTPGILNFVFWLNKPAVIRNEEIETIQKFLNEHTNIRLEKTVVNIQDKVRVVAGPLMNEEGEVISVLNRTIKVMLPSLGYCMHAEIETANVKLISSGPVSNSEKAFT